MTWRGRMVLGIPFAIAATLNLLDIIARPLHWRGEHIDGYCFLFMTPWGWLLDHVAIEAHNRWLNDIIAFTIILWIPALLYSACLWLLIWASKTVVRRLPR